MLTIIDFVFIFCQSPRKALEEKVGRPLAKRTVSIPKDSKIAMLMNKFNK